MQLHLRVFYLHAAFEEVKEGRVIFRKDSLMKKNNLTRWRGIGLALAVALTACIAVPGQQSKQFAQAQQENAKQLRQYGWKSRTEIRKGGETKSTKLYLMRYDVAGNLQKTLISETSQQLPKRGLRGLIAKKKKENFVEMLDGLGALAKSYGELPPDRMQQFMTNATFTPETNSQPGQLRLQGRDVLQPGDSMTIWVDAATRRQRRIEIQTTFDEKPVRIVSEFRDLPNGPTYPARSVIDYPSQELTITTDNFDYTRAQ
jgi:hypothetical protein